LTGRSSALRSRRTQGDGCAASPVVVVRLHQSRQRRRRIESLPTRADCRRQASNGFTVGRVALVDELQHLRGLSRARRGRGGRPREARLASALAHTWRDARRWSGRLAPARP
jgi:hypothetical protein